MKDLLARSGWVRLVLLVIVVSGALSVLVGSAAATPVSGSCSTTAGTATCTFTYTGAAQSFTVPDAVTQVTLDAFGAQGGSGNFGVGSGGAGGEATAVMAVAPGDTLTVQVGQQGGTNSGGTGGTGGFGGGGGGGTSTLLGGGAGGGGASSVSSGADALVIAGGGGGGSPWTGPDGQANGGSGGGLAGGVGATTADPPSAGPGGAPGTQVGGGVGAGGSGSGALGQGGAGADWASGAAYDCGGGGGGGGGGFYGGAGGSNCSGGGGGSGFVSPAATSSTLTAGVHSGDGVVTISYVPPDSTPPTASPTQDPAANGAGWNNTDVTVYWNWADEPGGSGLGGGCATSSTSTGEGMITLHSSCSDVAGNSASAEYTVMVDKTAPTFAPGDITVNATSPAGAVVPTPGATDNLDPSPTVVCAPPGPLFPIGDTVVSCTATDTAGNNTPASFTVHVRGAADQLEDLLAAVTGVGPGHALADTVKDIEKHVARNQQKDACRGLEHFIKRVEDMATGKKPKISQTQADSFIAQANNIKATLGC